MQQEKIVLPKFTVPGQTNWVKWALVGVGGMVALSVVAFGVALSKRNAADATAAATPKSAEVPLAPSATPRPVNQPSARLAAAVPRTTDPAPAAEEAPAPRVKASSHRPRRAHGGHKTLAKAGSGSSASTSSKSGKSDPLDDILKRFK
jgi:hypothetical protein